MTDLNDKIATLINSYTANSVSLALAVTLESKQYFADLIEYYDNELLILGIHL